VDCIEQRSCAAVRMRELAFAVLRGNEDVWEAGEGALHSPQVDEALRAHCDESNARALVALGLARLQSAQIDDTNRKPADCDDQPLGVLIFEWFTMRGPGEILRPPIELASRHAAIALDHVLAVERLPFIGVSRRLGKLRWLTQSRRRPLALIAACLAAFIVALALCPADLQVTADGELKPVQRRDIFAPANAVVDRVFVDHQDDVETGDTVVRLRSTELEYERARIVGEEQTAKKRLAALQAARFQTDGKESSVGRQLQLTAEEEEVKKTLGSLAEQRELLERQLAELEIAAPIKGRVLTWDAARTLAGRPVSRGQLLLSLGTLSGEWEAELHVPECQIGPVLDAIEEGRRIEEPVTVALVMSAEPTNVYRGEIKSVALRTEIDEHRGESIVVVFVRFLDHVDRPRPGAVVLAKIDCGRRSLGRVWFGDAWNSVRRRVLF